MPDIADWLQKLGLGQYAQRFAEDDIDIDVLNELTDQDFDRLGVSSGIAEECCERSESLAHRLLRVGRSPKRRHQKLRNPPLRTVPSVAK